MIVKAKYDGSVLCKLNASVFVLKIIHLKYIEKFISSGLHFSEAKKII